MKAKGIVWNDQPLGQDYDHVLAKLLGVSKSAVAKARRAREIPSFAPPGRPRRLDAPSKRVRIRKPSKPLPPDQHQKRLARQRIRRAGLVHSIEVLVDDAGLEEANFVARSIGITRSEMVRLLVRRSAAQLRAKDSASRYLARLLADSQSQA